MVKTERVKKMTILKKHILKKIYGILIIAGGLLLSSSSAYAQACQTGSKCSNSTCSLSLNANGHLSNNCPSGTRYDVDPNCVMNQNASPCSCMDTMPVASLNRVSETNCFRANGAGGNSKPRNHLGTDYAAVQGTTVTAAADGVVVWAKPMSGAGRTIVIEHEKECVCTVGNPGEGCDNKYVTVYMHLSAFFVNGGSVRKGQPIGKVGGSNYIGGKLCDSPYKAKYKGDCYSYGPHLHFEIHSGGWEKGYAELKKSIINPLCDDIQQFCGNASPYDVKQCQDKEGAQDWENLGDEAKQDKTQAASTGMSTPPVGSSSASSGSETSGSSSSEGSGKDCSLARFLPKSDKCWFCPMFKALFNTASAIALKAYKALESGVVNVVMMMFAIWVSVYILKHVSAVEVKDPRKMLQELMLQAFKVLIVVLILKVGYFQVMQLTLGPVFNTGMNFVQAISGGNACPAGASYMQNVIGYDSYSGVTENSKGGLPISMGQNILCSIKTMQDSVAKMMAFGRQAWCVAWGPKSFLFGFVPHFAYLITGVVIFLGGFILLIAFPWCLVDCVIQMSIAAGLAPAAIGAWAFKMTQHHLKKIWDFFMNAMFNFVFLSIILYIIMTIVNQFMDKLNQHANESTGWDFLIDPIEGVAYWGVTGTKLVVVCLIGWVFLDEGKNFADKFAEGSGIEVGRDVGGLFAQAANKGGKTALKAGKAMGGLVAEAGDNLIGSRVRNWTDNKRQEWLKRTGKEILDDDGNVVGYERSDRNLLFKKVTRRVRFDETGKGVYSKEKQSRRAELGNFVRGKVQNAREAIMFDNDLEEDIDLTNAVTRVDDEGNTVKESASGRVTFDKDGNIISREKFGKNIFGRQVVRNKESYDKDGNIVSKEHFHRNLIGRKVTNKQELGEDGNWNMTRSKTNVRMEILSNLTAGNKTGAVHKFAEKHIIAKKRQLGVENKRADLIQTDPFMSVREIRNKNGEIRQRDIAFNTKAVKYLVNKKGEINMDFVKMMMQQSNFDKKTIMEAIAIEVGKARGVNLESKFQSREVSFNEQTGQLSIYQINMDGTKTILDAQLGGPNGNQMLTKVTTVAKNLKGQEYVASIQKSNGIQSSAVRRLSTGEYTVQYAWGDEYNRLFKYQKPLNYQGKFATGFDANAAMFGFEDDFNMHLSQIRTGKPSFYTGNVDVPLRASQAYSGNERQLPQHKDGTVATADNPITQTTKDANGWLSTAESYVDSKGRIVNKATIKDEKGRVREDSYKDDTGASYYSKTDYDDANRTSIEKKTMTDANGQTTTTTTYRQYDEHGNIVSEHDNDPNAGTSADDTRANGETPEQKAAREAQEKAEREAQEKAEREAKEKAEREAKEAAQKALNRTIINTESITKPDGTIVQITKDANGVVLSVKQKKTGEDKFSVSEQRTTYANGNVCDEVINDSSSNMLHRTQYDEHGNKTHEVSYEGTKRVFERRYEDGVERYSYIMNKEGEFLERTFDEDGLERVRKDNTTFKDRVTETRYHKNGKEAFSEQRATDDSGFHSYEIRNEDGVLTESLIEQPGYYNKHIYHEDGRVEHTFQQENHYEYTVSNGDTISEKVIKDGDVLVKHLKHHDKGYFDIRRTDDGKYYRNDYDINNKLTSEVVTDSQGKILEKTEFGNNSFEKTKYLENGYTEVSIFAMQGLLQKTTLYDANGKKVKK